MGSIVKAVFMNYLFHLFNIFQLISFQEINLVHIISQEPFLCSLKSGVLKFPSTSFWLEELAFGCHPTSLLVSPPWCTAYLYTLYLNNGTMQRGPHLWFGSYSLHFKWYYQSVRAQCLGLTSSDGMHINFVFLIFL